MYGCGEDCLVLIPFRLPQISCYPLSLKCFSSDSDNCPDAGIRSLLQFPEGRSSPTNTPVFPPSSFILASFVWVFIFFSAGQVLLSTLSWCSALTCVSEGVSLMYPWREMYSTSTYSCAILFFLGNTCWFHDGLGAEAVFAFRQSAPSLRVVYMIAFLGHLQSRFWS